MTIEEIKNMVEKEEYDFLRTNPHLSGRLVFLTLGGSYAYGTNVETSDVDIRGCALNRKSDLLGLSNFEQVVNTETDTTVYSFNITGGKSRLLVSEMKACPYVKSMCMYSIKALNILNGKGIVSYEQIHKI